MKLNWKCCIEWSANKGPLKTLKPSPYSILPEIKQLKNLFPVNDELSVSLGEYSELNEQESNWDEAGRVGVLDSRSSFSLEAPSDESLFIPFVGGEHVGAVMDAKNRHLISILKIL